MPIKINPMALNLRHDLARHLYIFGQQKFIQKGSVPLQLICHVSADRFTTPTLEDNVCAIV